LPDYPDLLLTINSGSERESGRWMMVEVWWMGEEALVKERRVT
jgi:hypothetical protein